MQFYGITDELPVANSLWGELINTSGGIVSTLRSACVNVLIHCQYSPAAL